MGARLKDDELTEVINKLTAVVEAQKNAPSKADLQRIEAQVCHIRDDVREDLALLRGEFRNDLNGLRADVTTTQNDLSAWQGRMGMFLVGIGAVIGSAASAFIDWMAGG